MMAYRLDDSADARSKALSRLGGNTATPGGLSTSNTYGPPAWDPQNPPVFMGSITRNRREPEARGVGSNRPNPTIRQVGSTTTERIVTRQEALGEFYTWVGTPKMKKWADHLVKVGLIDPADAGDYGTLAKLWEDAVNESSNAYTLGRQRKIDPWKMAEYMGGAVGGSGARAGGAQAPFTGTKTDVRRDVDLTSPENAKALVNDTLSRQLGRAATDDEIAQFTAVLNNAQRSNPTVTTTNTTFNAGEQTGSSSTTTGGVSQAAAGELFDDAAMAKPEFGAYQSATTYYNALLSAMQSPV